MQQHEASEIQQEADSAASDVQMVCAERRMEETCRCGAQRPAAMNPACAAGGVPLDPNSAAIKCLQDGTAGERFL